MSSPVTPPSAYPLRSVTGEGTDVNECRGWPWRKVVHGRGLRRTTVTGREPCCAHRGSGEARRRPWPRSTVPLSGWTGSPPPQYTSDSTGRWGEGPGNQEGSDPDRTTTRPKRRPSTRTEGVPGPRTRRHCSVTTRTTSVVGDTGRPLHTHSRNRGGYVSGKKGGVVRDFRTDPGPRTP